MKWLKILVKTSIMAGEHFEIYSSQMLSLSEHSERLNTQKSKFSISL